MAVVQGKKKAFQIGEGGGELFSPNSGIRLREEK